MRASSVTPLEKVSSGSDETRPASDRSELRDRDGLARGPNAGSARVGEAGNVICVVVADRHAETFLGGVVEKMTESPTPISPRS